MRSQQQPGSNSSRPGFSLGLLGSLPIILSPSDGQLQLWQAQAVPLIPLLSPLQPRCIGGFARLPDNPLFHFQRERKLEMELSLTLFVTLIQCYNIVIFMHLSDHFMSSSNYSETQRQLSWQGNVLPLWWDLSPFSNGALPGLSDVSPHTVSVKHLWDLQSRNLSIWQVDKTL